MVVQELNLELWLWRYRFLIFTIVVDNYHLLEFLYCYTFLTVAPVLAGIFEWVKYHYFWERNFQQQPAEQQRHSSDIWYCYCYLYFAGPLYPICQFQQDISF